MAVRYRLEHTSIDDLLAALGAGGRVVVGPTERDGAIVLDQIRSAADLPRGRTATQAAGSYRMADRDDGALFGFTVGPDAPKRWLFPPRVELFRASRTAESFALSTPEPPPPLALLGVRACDLAAIAIHDRVLLREGITDPAYASRRADLLLVAVQCAASASTCFCASMGAGPRVEAGYDLCLTEVTGEAAHFVVEVGSEAGRRLIEGLGCPAVVDVAPEQAAAAAAAQQTRTMPHDVRDRLLGALEGPHWDDVATRCLGCANCTLVCPTCFCTTVEDVTLLSGDAVRTRRWDSCFDQAFTDLHGEPVRGGVGERYRQWLTHKLATWHDQFGTSGCVGCGRCVAWCPAGIDLVEEARRAGGS